jgi:hypothetical protein
MAELCTGNGYFQTCPGKFRSSSEFINEIKAGKAALYFRRLFFRIRKNFFSINYSVYGRVWRIFTFQRQLIIDERRSVIERTNGVEFVLKTYQ